MQLFGKNSSDVRKLVSINFGFEIKDPLFIQVIHPYLSRCMYDSVSFEQYTYVVDFTFVILKKNQITWLTLFNAPESFPLIRLLPAVAKQPVSANLEYHLNESRTVNTERTLALAPEVAH